MKYIAVGMVWCGVLVIAFILLQWAGVFIEIECTPETSSAEALVMYLLLVGSVSLVSYYSARSPL